MFLSETTHSNLSAILSRHLGRLPLEMCRSLGGELRDLASDGNEMWVHEMQDTYQSQLLGPLYLPSNLMGGVLSVVTGGAWIGQLNWNEIGPQQHPLKPW